MRTSHLLYKLRFASLYEIFGDNPRDTYAQMAKSLHPDVNRENLDAEKNFQLLAERYAELKELESYPNDADFGITVGGKSYAFYRTLKRGDTSTLYLGHDEYGTSVVARLPASPDFNQFIQAERSAIRKMSEKKRKTIVATGGEASFSATYPDLIAFADKLDGELSINISQYCGGFITLTEAICKYGYLSGPQMSAIWNKILLAISLAASADVIHGAIVPEHILINPSSGEVLLCGWAFSVNTGQALKYKIPSFAGFYPDEAFTKPNTSTDIYMSAACMKAAISVDKTEAKLLNVLNATLMSGVSFRMKSAVDVFTAFHSAIHETGSSVKFSNLE